MKLLKDILYKAGIEELVGATNIAIENIEFDSRKVKKNSLFVAVTGTNTDGHLFISKALQNGAVAIVCNLMPSSLKPGVTYIRVKNSSEALGILAANFYDNPSQKIKVVGITGTNGKTTVATSLYKLFKSNGYKVGLISTIKILIDEKVQDATHTTPDAISLQRVLSEMVKSHCSYCFMEVSSIALHQHRVSGLQFAGAVFTNITHDHLDYHGTFSEYIRCKKMLFDGLSSSAFAITNSDDKNGTIMLQNCKAKKFTYALKNEANFKAKILESHFNGLLLSIENQEVWVKFSGEFNAYNLLSIYVVALQLGLDKTRILTSMSTLPPVEGRLNVYNFDNNIVGIVDYAHTPDALQNVIQTILKVKNQTQKLITIIGCGGDRDREKRPVMGKIAAYFSDLAIFTSDNPRSENPESILSDMKLNLDLAEFKKILSITNRREAIMTAAKMANPGDIILIAGKGHEKYQEIKGEKFHFDDAEELKKAFKILNS